MRNNLLFAIKPKFRKTLTFLIGLLLISGVSWAQNSIVGTTQASIADVSQNTSNQEIIGIILTATANNQNAEVFNFTLTGTGISGTDLTNATLWSTGTSSTFAASSQYGTVVATPGGTFSFSDGNFKLTKNVNNYFWLTFDVPSGATVGNTLDAKCTNVTIEGTPLPHTGDPAGSRIIVGPPPEITSSVSSLSSFNYTEGSGPSAEQSFTVEGSSLTANIVLTAPTNYEISTSSGSGFTNSITLTQSGGTVATTTIYVRLKASLSTGAYNTETITASSTGATDVDITCNGTVSSSAASCGSETFTNSNATASYLDGSFTGDNSVTWTYIQSRNEDSYGITGNGLMLRRASDLSKVSSSSVAGGIGDFTCSLRKAFTGAGNRQVELYVGGVLKGTSLAWDNTDIQSFTVTGIDISGAVTIEIRNITEYQVIVDDISWTCYAGTSPTITVSETNLTGFTYEVGSGPSAEQSFTIEGTNLTNDISITPPTNYEISTTTGGAFSATNPITLTQSGGTVSTTTIYVRLISGLSTNTYNDENITASSTGATSKTVECDGIVTAVGGSGCSTDLIISEYAEGSGNNKYIEIYNGTGSSVDLSNYILKQSYNGAGWDADVNSPYNKPLSGILANEDVFVISASDASATILAQADLTISYNASVQGGKVIFFSGNDAMGLFKSTTLIDVFGDPSSSSTIPVAGFSTYGGDHTIIRKETIFDGNTNWASSSGTNTTDSEWIGYAQDTWTYLGSHVMTCANDPEPTNNATSFSCGTTASSSIQFTWTDAVAGAQAPDKYLILCNTTGTFSDPVDGTSQTDSEGSIANIAYSTESATFTGLTSGTTYYFKVFSYTNSGTQINYKTDGTILTGNCATTTVSLAAISDNGTQVSTANVLTGTVNHILHKFKIDVTVFDGTISGLQCETAGSYASASITNIKAWYSTDATFESGSDALLSTFTTPGTAGTKIFPSFTSQLISSGSTGYIFITTDISTSAISGNTIRINAVTTSDLTMTSVVISGSTTSGGIQTIIKPEPTNHATAFSCGTTSFESINFTWTDAISGSQTPDTYLILCNTTGTFTNPVDGTPQSDIEGSISNISYGVQTVTFTGLNPSTTYYFKAFSYTNTNSYIDYKTDGTPLSGNCSTTTPPDVFISEIAGYGLTSGTFNNEYIELTNRESYSMSLDNWQLLYYENGSLERTLTFGASHSIPANDAFVVAVRTSYTGALSPDYIPATSFSINNSNNYVVLKDNNGTIYDEAGSSSDAFDCDYNYEFTQCDEDNNPVSNWDNLGETEGTPGIVNCIQCILPTSASTTLNFTSITANAMTLDWTNGDGFRRIVIASEGSAVSFTPTDLNTYEANSVFSDGIDLGSGNVCVYNGDGSSVTVSGLNGSTTYYFEIFEYSCLPGSELYYGTSLTGNQATTLSPISNLHVVCQTNTTAQVEWTAPTGDYTGVVISIRNDALTPHDASGDATTFTADPIYESGYEYGSTTPHSFVVYNGIGTSVTITGLTAGQPYTIEAYTYKNNTSSIWSDSHPTTSISSLGTSDVSNHIALADNTQVQLQWTPPDASCYDEVLIIANEGAAITTQPTGDGSSYTGDLAFDSGTVYGTGYVVYKGGFSPQTVTGLTNSTTYCFTWFVRSGTSWSQGVSACATPLEITILLPGDLAIIAVNTQAQNSGSADEICFFCFKDIATGTAIDFTDNGYERVNEDEWADSEGTIRLTYTGVASIPAGQVICFQGQGYQSTDFDIFTCGTLDNANWTVTSLNSTGGYDLNVDDQIWIMQGGAWDYGGTLYNHDAYYSGNVLYGWTATGWKPNYGYNSTKGSTIFPGLECFNTDVTVNANHEKVKYIGSLTNATQFEWLSRINDDANWWGYADNTAYNSVAGRDYSGTCITFDIGDLISIGSAGVWTGTSGEDWFDCSNWENLRIPNGSVDVEVTGAVGNFITVDDGIASVPEAECNSLTIASDAKRGTDDLKLKINHTDAVLNIYGDMSNDQIIEHTAGEIHYKGDFTNNDTYTHNTAGTAIFDGSIAQALTGATTFYNLQINNTSTGLTINNDITINNILSLSDGLINTGSNTVIIDSDATTAITDYSTNSYINGLIRRKVASSGSYDLPVGSSTNYQLANINLTSSTIDYLNAQFTDTHAGTSLPNTPYITVDTDDITELIDNGFWTISPVTGNATDYDVTLISTGHTNGGADPTDHTIVKRTNAAGDWTSYDTNHDDATQSGSGSNPITAVLTSLSGFSDLSIAKKQESTLPVELLYFSAKHIEQNVILNWQTASEINNEFFNIERSIDGFTFEYIGRINGAGNSRVLNKYEFIDDSPILGTSYYRLQQIDYDGEYEYSNIENVFIKSYKTLNVYNIIDSDYAASLIVDNPNKSNLTLNITDMTGKIIYSEKLDNPEEQFKVQIEKSRLRPGMYIFHVYNQYETATQKVVVF